MKSFFLDFCKSNLKIVIFLSGIPPFSRKRFLKIRHTNVTLLLYYILYYYDNASHIDIYDTICLCVCVYISLDEVFFLHDDHRHFSLLRRSHDRLVAPRWIEILRLNNNKSNNNDNINDYSNNDNDNIINNNNDDDNDDGDEKNKTKLSGIHPEASLTVIVLQDVGEGYGCLFTRIEIEIKTKQAGENKIKLILTNGNEREG